MQIYDSQDELYLAIYCKLESPISGKKLNVFRFSFVLEDLRMSDYEEWLQSVLEVSMKDKNLESLLESGKIL